MSTRSMIAKVNKDDSVTAIYCHNDGYFAHVGKILARNYTSEDLVDKLLELGNLSILGSIPVDDPDLWREFHDDSEKCRSYKGRGDNGNSAKKYNSVKEAINELGQSYNYFFIDGDWYCRKSDGELYKLLPDGTPKRINKQTADDDLDDLEEQDNSEVATRVVAEPELFPEISEDLIKRMEKIASWKNYQPGTLEENIEDALDRGSSLKDAVEEVVYGMEQYGDNPPEN